MDYSAGGLFLHPGGLMRGDLFIGWAIGSMRAWQVPGGHEEFVDDLAACEDEGFLQDLNTITTAKG